MKSRAGLLDVGLHCPRVLLCKFFVCPGRLAQVFPPARPLGTEKCQTASELPFSPFERDCIKYGGA